ncbi:alpha/beta fold hydrolase [Arthrobacter sp. SLBN-100]|uniref:alpha/beta fold hydrolase n=1 Tax=Arthrobacter sp. SLBN-100 TaxID=2768450 RepID=UPI00135B2EE7|nr:alpha/beta hydrolase [Arthrobacter sp. SLBN-100]
MTTDELSPTLFDTHRLEVRDGVTLAFVREGLGGVPLLLLHGWPGSKRLFWHNIAPLAEMGFEVIVPDQRGFGDSGPAEAGRLDPVASSRDMAALLQGLGHEQAIVCAGDQGGVVAMDMSLRFPELVSRMVLYNTAVPVLPDVYEAAGLPANMFEEIGKVSEHMSLHGLQADELCASLDTEDERLDYVASFFTGHVWKDGDPVRQLAATDGFSPEQAAFQAEPFRDPAVMRASLGIYEAFLGAGEPFEPPMLDRPIEVETMILYGIEDEIIGDYWPQEMALACRRPVGPFLLQGAGHFVPWETAEVFNHALRAFCRDLLQS